MTGYCLEELAFWDKLSDQERERVRAAAYEADYEPGQMIWSGERDCLGLLLIRSGVVRLFLLSEDGREATISRISGGQVCIMTASCTMSVSSFNVQVQAEGRVEALVIPAVCLSTLVRDNLYVENFLYRGATQHFSQVLTAVEQMLFRTLEQRLAAYLLEECERLGTDTLKVTQEQMAQAIGSAREAVTRTLKKLAASGAVELFRGGVKLTDKNDLERRL